MTRILVAIGLFLSAGCAVRMPHVERSPMDLEDQAKIGEVILDWDQAYLIDARSEACFLRLTYFQSVSMTPVSCAALKRNVPEAARFITWDPPADATPGR